jgi:hypothetical protein
MLSSGRRVGLEYRSAMSNVPGFRLSFFLAKADTSRQDRTPPGVATNANPPKGGDAKLRGYRRRVPPKSVGLPNEPPEGSCCPVLGVWNSCSP